MAKQKTIKLIEPIRGHEGQIAEVVLREPRGADYFSLGDPYHIFRTADGSMTPVENDQVIRQYIDRCCVSPDPILLANLSLHDARAVKEAVLGFFLPPSMESTPAATSSSSN